MTAKLDPVSGALRTLRGSLLAATAGALAVAAHGVAGGTVASTSLTALVVSLVALASIRFADRRRSGATILIALGGAQLAQHLLLDLLDGHRHGAGQPALVDPLAMTVAHAAAALLTAVLLSRAESVLFAMAAAFGALPPRRAVPLPVSAPLRCAVAPTEPAHLAMDVLLCRVHSRRGPPANS